jgi:hypothetical protein
MIILVIIISEDRHSENCVHLEKDTDVALNLVSAVFSMKLLVDEP